MVLPVVPGAALMEVKPSISIRPGGQGSVVSGLGHSLVRSIAGVSASVPVPAIGQTFGLDGKSVAINPVERLVMQVALCQSGLLSLRTPKFEPPTISK